ncbi:MAG: hypothetical protein JWO06_1453 [Bacteroidota bacterium]|nr:hypothetical protein [Bacteroidota bacterium]
MNFSQGEIYHVFNRGNQRQEIFFTTANYLFFLHKMRKEVLPKAEILAYCLMPNHFHFLIFAKPEADGISSLNRKIGTLQSSYTRAIQKQEKFTGSLFQQKAKAVPVKTNQQMHNCFHYIHQNPIKANLVAKMEDWEFSSFREYWKPDKNNLCNQSLLHSLLNINQNSFYDLSYAALPKWSDE